MGNSPVDNSLGRERSAPLLGRQQVEAAARYLARLVVEAQPEQRLRVLRGWAGELEDGQGARILPEVVLALAGIVDACSELSPRVREWVRDELMRARDPFRAAMPTGPQGDHGPNRPATVRDPGGGADSRSAARATGGASRG